MWHDLQCFHIEDATVTDIPDFDSSIKWRAVQIMCAMTECKALKATTNSHLPAILPQRSSALTSRNSHQEFELASCDLRLTEIASRCCRVKVEWINRHVSTFQTCISRLRSPDACQQSHMNMHISLPARHQSGETYQIQYNCVNSSSVNSRT